MFATKVRTRLAHSAQAPGTRLADPPANRHCITVAKVTRYDIGHLSPPTRMDNGYLRADARITSTGVFIYKNPDGSPRRELRIPDEVFHQDALASFELVPFTNEHPTEPLDSKNTARHASGTVFNVRRDGDDFVAATIQITDAAVIDAADTGKRQLSCGYDCDLEITPGITKDIPGVPDGLRFDAIQRNIRGNHVALVAMGKAGLAASLRLDHGELVTELPKEQNKMRIDGIEYEVSTQAEQAVDKSLADKDKETLRESARADSAEEEVDREKLRADEAETKLAEETKRADEATKAETIGAAVKTRVKLEQDAVSILGERKDGETPLADLDDEAIKREVVLKASPNADPDKLKGEALNARFDPAVETFKTDEQTPKPNAGLAAVRLAIPHVDGPQSDNPIADSITKMHKDNQTAWQVKKPAATA